MNDAALLILTYGPASRHRQLVEGALADGVPAERVLIVHNPDGTTAGARPWSPPGVATLVMDENVGYGHAMNAGVARARAEGARRLLLLTQDVRFEPGGLTALLAAGRQAGAFGILGPVLRDEATGAIYSYGGLDDRRTIARHRTERPEPTREGIVPCDWVDGCALLVQADALAAAGTLRGEFFMYFEEAELCLRVRRCGWQVGVVLNAVASTAPGGPSRPASYGYLFCRNGLAYARAASGWGGVRRGVATQLRMAWELLPKPHQRPFYEVRHQRWALAWLVGIAAGVIAFLAGRWGPPPPILQRMGDIRGTAGGGRAREQPGVSPP